MNDSSPIAKPADMTLYSYEFSPFAAKVRCYLGFKQLNFKTHYVHPLRAKAEIPLGNQVPVLSIDGECRNDSTQIGLWLDEKFPTKLLVPTTSPDQRSAILKFDAFVTSELVPLCFRLMLGHGGHLAKRFRNGAIGANGVHQTVQGGYALPLRLLHPFLVPKAPFIQQIINSSDLNQSNRQLVSAICEKLTTYLEDGLYMMSGDTASLADLSAFAQLALPYLAGYDDVDAIEQFPAVLSWMKRIQQLLPADAGLRSDLHRREFG